MVFTGGRGWRGSIVVSLKKHALTDLSQCDSCVSYVCSSKYWMEYSGIDCMRAVVRFTSCFACGFSGSGL